MVTQDAKVKEKVREIWDRRAPEYDNHPGHGIHSEREKEAWKDLFNEVIGLEKRTVLDVGCGTGVITLLLAEMGHQATGIDISKAMLDTASKKAQEQGLSIELVLGDAETLPFDERSFDIVVSRHVLWTLPDPEAALLEWHRVLKPGGKVIILDGDWGERDIRKKIWRILASPLILITEGRLHSLRSYRKVMEYLPMSHRKRPEADIEILKKTGFEVVKVKETAIPRTRNFMEFLKYGYFNGHFLVVGIKEQKR